MTNENNTSAQAATSQTQPDFIKAEQEVETSLLFASWCRQEQSGRYSLRDELRALTYSPEALNAMGLCKVDDIVKESQSAAALQYSYQLESELTEAKKQLNELKKATEANGTSYNDVKKQLKAVREMRDRLLDRLIFLQGYIECNINHCKEKPTYQTNESLIAKAQQAKEKESEAKYE